MNLRGFRREVKVFTMLESRKQYNETQSVREVLNTGAQHDGLPKLLGYQINEDSYDVLMENAGPPLSYWQS